MSDPKDNKVLLIAGVPIEEQIAVAEAEDPPAGTSTVGFMGPLTKDSLGDYTEFQTVRNAKRVIPRIFRALAKGIDRGDNKCIELGMSAYGFIGKGAGVTIINNLLQANYQGGGRADRQQEVYFEKIVRSMDQEDQAKKIHIIDAESEELD